MLSFISVSPEPLITPPPRTTTNKLMHNSKVFIGNLAHTISENELNRMFAAHGPVTDVKIPMDRESGRPRGFAFVTMATPEAAHAAIQALNGQTIAEQTITVGEARSRDERPAFNSSTRDPRRAGNSRGGHRRF
jgi:RNA recognition motif-containing protein